MANDELTLGADFPSPNRDDWLALVDKVLNGAPFDRKLVTTTREGLRIEPLYAAGDEPGPVARPHPAAARTGAWDVRQYHHNDDLEALNAAILTDLERGVTSIVLGPCAITTVDQLDRALAGVHLELAPIVLDWGPQAPTGVVLLTQLWLRRAVDPGAIRSELGLDPLGTLARHGWLTETLEASLAALATTAADTARRWPQVRAVRVDASPYADAGGSDALELAAAMATGVAYLRAMTGAGLDIDAALRQISFRFTANADQFATMAKLRAARRLWARITEASGATSPAARVEQGSGSGMVIHAVTAAAMYSQRDPWVNLLRATLACFAAATAGADAITVAPFGAAAGRWDELGLRLARNTQIILAEESGLARVADPAGGSWYVENRSEALAAAAWTRFQAIEAAGGMAQALLDGSIAQEAQRTWESRRADLARRKDALTGVSEFADLDELPLNPPGAPTATNTLTPAETPPDAYVRIEPLPLRRLAAPFEELRDRADALAAGPTGRPSVFLANLGPLATHAARATFAKNFFEVGGIRAAGGDGFDGPAEVAAAFGASGSDRAVICSSDAVYAEQADAVARALKAAGCVQVYLAGNPGDARSAYEAAGVDEFIYVGCDLLDILGRALS